MGKKNYNPRQYNSKNGGKPRQNYSRDGSKRSSTNPEEVSADNVGGTSTNTDRMGCKNNPAFYMDNAGKAAILAQIPFGTPSGKMFPGDFDGRSFRYGVFSSTEPIAKIAAPGFCVIDVHPTLGTCNSVLSPINVAMTKMYSDIRASLAYNAFYTPNDLFMYAGAMDSILTLNAYIVLAFKMINAYQSNNYYMPEGLYEALYNNTPIEDANRYAELMARFNLLNDKAAVLYFPRIYPLIERHLTIFSNIYRDVELDKAQIYAFKMCSVNLLVEDVLEEGAALRRYDISSYTLSGLLDAYEEMIERLWRTDLTGAIIADMKKAFPSIPLLFPTSYMGQPLEIMHDRHIMLQIHNLQVAKGPNCISNTASDEYVKEHFKDGDTWNTYPIDPFQGIRFQPTYTCARYAENEPINNTDTQFVSRYMSMGNYLNLDVNVPSPEDVIESSRLQYSMSRLSEDPNNITYLLEAPADIVSSVKMYAYKYNDEGAKSIVTICELLPANAINERNNSSGLTIGARAAGWSAFDWAPQGILYCFYSEGAAPAPFYYTASRLWEINNIGNLTGDQLTRLNDQIVANMWSIPTQLSSANAKTPR